MSPDEEPTTIAVKGQQPSENYPVLVGHNLLKELPSLLGSAVQRVLVIHPRALRTTG